jgi:hypothetical protein
LSINNIFNSHTLNPSRCGPEKTKSTLGKTKKWVLSTQQQLKLAKSV